MVQKGTTTRGGKKPDPRGSPEAEEPHRLHRRGSSVRQTCPAGIGSPLRQRDWNVMGSAIHTGTFLSRFKAGENRKT